MKLLRNIKKNKGIILISLVSLLFVFALIEYVLHSSNNKDSFLSEPGISQIRHSTPRMHESFESIKVGSNSYKVHEDLKDPVFAAQTMDQLNTTAQKLIKVLNDKYIENKQGLNTIKPEYRDIVRQGIISLSKNFKTANMEENIPERSGGDTSYVIDKGDVFAMCLRDPNNNNIVDVSNNMNELNFVLIHEMAHLFTSTYGHDAMFWNNFKFMLNEASIADLYTPVDYKKNKRPYCGIVISYSPLYDVELKDYLIHD